jgi:succinylglutamic semialdehyde dehydrogenase
MCPLDPSNRAESLFHNYVGEGWTQGSGEPFEVANPSSGTTLYTVVSSSEVEVDKAVATAEAALASWSECSLDKRESLLQRYAELITEHADAIAATISREVGKPRWEAATEVKTMAGKINLSIDAYRSRCADFGQGVSHTRFKPHGVMAVFGPFNFPCHLPNGHIVPALLAGNTVVFKPSEMTPESSAWIVRLLLKAGLPSGVIQMVQGRRKTGEALANHARIDGLAFTGSAETGEILARAFARNPGKILALELGGNNPLVAWNCTDLDATALTVLQSAFITAGQRCTCARRLILPDNSWTDKLIETLSEKTPKIRVGGPETDPPPFCGPVISATAARRLLDEQSNMLEKGASTIVPLTQIAANTGLLLPGILDVTPIEQREDRELFGPLLQIIRVPDFESAIAEANRTQFGLVSGLLCDDEKHYRHFYQKARAGLINWNTPLPGASGAAPFGGIGRSGNHRPSGFFAADYCSYPVASMENSTLEFPEKPLPGLW